MTVTDLVSPRDAIMSAGAHLGIEDDVVEAAADVAHSAPLLAFSGWLASGKDSVAEDAYKLLPVPSTKTSLAAPLKDELTRLMRIAGSSYGYTSAIIDVAREMEVPRKLAENTIDLIVGERRMFHEAREDFNTLTGWDRTSEVRLALQYWGTDVRRAQRSSYWVDRATEAAIRMLATGVVPYFCDCRFPDEVIGLQRIGYRVVRLTITRETQRERLLARDGIEPDHAALFHSSERALDDFDGFDLVIDNNGPPGPSVAAVLAITS